MSTKSAHPDTGSSHIPTKSHDVHDPNTSPGVMFRTPLLTKQQGNKRVAGSDNLSFHAPSVHTVCYYEAAREAREHNLQSIPHMRFYGSQRQSVKSSRIKSSTCCSRGDSF
eukprot:2185790-Amphidinium_carterae.2